MKSSSDELRERTLMAIRDHLDECSACQLIQAKILAHWSILHPKEATALLHDSGMLKDGEVI